MLDILVMLWEFFVNNFLTKPAYFIGLLVAVGYKHENLKLWIIKY